MKTTRSADFCADQIDVIANFAVITNVVIKRAHCTCFPILVGYMRLNLTKVVVVLKSIWYGVLQHNCSGTKLIPAMY